MTSGVGASANYRLTEEQELLRATVRRLAEERIAPRAAEIDRTEEFPWDVKALLAEHEILALAYPSAYGGLGAELLTLCLAIEELSRVCATSGLILAVQALGSLPLQLAGSEEQKARWLPDLAAGRRLVAFAMTEPEAGSDPAAMRTRAHREGGGYRLEGTKRFISQGGVADLYAVFAVTDPAARRGRGISCFMVDADSAGLAVARLEHKMGIRGSPTAELVFDGVPVPADRRVGAEGEGFRIGLRTLDLRPGGDRRGDPLCRRARPVRPPDRGAPDGRGDAGGHGHADRGGAPAPLPRLRRDRSGWSGSGPLGRDV